MKKKKIYIYIYIYIFIYLLMNRDGRPDPHVMVWRMCSDDGLCVTKWQLQTQKQ